MKRLTFWLTLVTVLFVTMILFLGTVWLIRTVMVLQGVGIWPLVAIAVTGSLFGFVVGSLELRRAVSEST